MRGRGERERDEKKAKVNQYTFQYIIHVVYVMCMHVLNQTRDSLLKSLHLQRPTGPANYWKSLQTQDARE